MTRERSTMLACTPSRRRSRKRYLRRISSGYSASALTGNGSGCASERSASSATFTSISPVDSFGLTVSAERLTTLPVTVTVLSSFNPSACLNSGLDTSITHWVMP